MAPTPTTMTIVMLKTIPRPDDDLSNYCNDDDDMISNESAEHKNSGYNSDGTDVSEGALFMVCYEDIIV